MIVVGIDPGLHGALCALDSDGGIVSYLNTPSGNKRLEVKPIVTWLYELPRVDRVVIEQVSSMPGEGHSGAFTFGRGVGCLEGIIETLGMPLVSVTPANWKRRFTFTGKEKDAPRLEAQRRWPTCDAFTTKARGQAVADAAFIALWGAS
jgi:hypothetical protein